MPIYQEGQSKAKAWFSEEFEFPSENDAEALLAAPPKALLDEGEDCPTESSESASEKNTSEEELPEADEIQETVPQYAPQKPAHEGSSGALPQNFEPPSVPQGQFLNQAPPALSPSPTYAGNQGPSERLDLVPSPTYASEGPSELLAQSSASTDSVEELRRKHRELKQELEMARLEAEIEEMKASLAELRSGKTDRRRITSQRGNGGLELEINLRVRY